MAALIESYGADNAPEEANALLRRLEQTASRLERVVPRGRRAVFGGGRDEELQAADDDLRSTLENLCTTSRPLPRSGPRVFDVAVNWNIADFVCADDPEVSNCHDTIGFPSPYIGGTTTPVVEEQYPPTDRTVGIPVMECSGPQDTAIGFDLRTGAVVAVVLTVEGTNYEAVVRRLRQKYGAPVSLGPVTKTYLSGSTRSGRAYAIPVSGLGRIVYSVINDDGREFLTGDAFGFRHEARIRKSVQYWRSRSRNVDDAKAMRFKL